MKLQDKIILVTGAGSGIGAETARRMAAQGAKVYCADINAASATAIAAEITESGNKAEALTLDVTDAVAIDAGFETIMANDGRVDVVVNNAGITIVGSIMALTEDEWDREMDINLKSIFRMSRKVWPIMEKQKGGVILNTASIAGVSAIPDDAAYCTSKAGVIMLTKCMAVDGAKVGIRVNCVCPGFIETPMIQGYFNDQEDPSASREFATNIHPLGRLGRPSDIADTFVHLASEEACWITGTAQVVDGGLLAGI